MFGVLSTEFRKSQIHHDLLNKVFPLKLSTWDGNGSRKKEEGTTSLGKHFHYRQHL